MSSCRIVSVPEEFQAACAEARAGGARVGLVPTMGALHEGHLALVREAKRRASFVAVSIFVNPTQFGPNEDFERYPRDLAGDAAKVASAGADVVFAPDPRGMYPEGDETRVRVGATAESLCGPFRPGHFEGVATVVTKLLCLAGPCVALFGRKDYQQLAVIRRFTRDLFLPVEVVGHPIVREADGLAMSSRNAYLSPAERARALGLSRALAAASAAFAGGNRTASALRAVARRVVDEVADSVDYVDVVDGDRLTPLADGVPVAEGAVVAIACRIGGTRLIDNLRLGEPPPGPGTVVVA